MWIAWLPINIELFGVMACPAAPQHVHPPSVAVTDSHMVGDDVEDQPHFMLAELAHQAVQSVFSTKLGIDRLYIDSVISMGRAGPRRHDGGGVQVTDAESSDVADQDRGVGKGKVSVELDEKRCARSD